MILHIDGHDFLIDEDMAHLAELRWRIRTNAHLGSPEQIYAYAGKVWLHRAVLGLETVSARLVVSDHRDGNTLDCRRSNLRCATHSQNQHNARKRADNTSGAKGVSMRSNGRWRAYIKLGGRQKELGSFVNIEEAIDARAKAAAEMHGRFARA